MLQCKSSWSNGGHHVRVQVILEQWRSSCFSASHPGSMKVIMLQYKSSWSNEGPHVTVQVHLGALQFAMKPRKSSLAHLGHPGELRSSWIIWVHTETLEVILKHWRSSFRVMQGIQQPLRSFQSNRGHSGALKVIIEQYKSSWRSSLSKRAQKVILKKWRLCSICVGYPLSHEGYPGGMDVIPWVIKGHSVVMEVR